MKPKPSRFSLILTNLFPVFGVLFLNWNLASILFLYWFENIVIGFFNVLKMSQAQKPNLTRVIKSTFGKTTIDKSKRSLIIFFALHYGIFTFAHGIILFTVLIKNFTFSFSLFSAIVFLFISHGISYLSNYINTKEYQRISSGQLMTAPYKRVVVMHLTIILGSIFFINIQGQSVGPLITLTLIKTIIDYFSHILEHNNIILNTPNSHPKNFVINMSLIKKLLPNYENIIGQAYKKSVETGKWQKIKKQIDPKTVKEIEDYWENK